MKTVAFLLLLLSSFVATAGVVGGGLVRAPWVIRMSVDGNTHCSGTLISPLHVLTAAHCFYGVQIHPAAMLVSGGGDGSAATLVTLPSIASVAVHPQYRGAHTVARDFAVVRLNAPIRPDHFLHPIPLRDTTGLRLRGLDVLIAGWGRTSPFGPYPDQLRGLVTRIFRTETAKLTSPAGEIIQRLFKGPEIFGFEGETHLTCGGDSGTGWVINPANEGPQLIAVHSQGDCRSFGLAAEITPVIPWVRAQVEMLQ